MYMYIRLHYCFFILSNLLSVLLIVINISFISQISETQNYTFPDSQIIYLFIRNTFSLTTNIMNINFWSEGLHSQVLSS